MGLGNAVRTLGLFAGAAASLALFLWQEGRAQEPMLPLDLFRNRLIAVASLGNVLLGTLLFAITAYVPMFAQGVLGGTAVDAGTILTPILVAWPISSTLAGRYLLRVGYRRFALFGSLVVIGGAVMLALVDASTTRVWVLAAMGVIGFGLGFLSMPYLLGPQNAVSWQRRGVATSSVQFFRSMGGAVSVAALGALFNARWTALAPDIDPNTALDPRSAPKPIP